MRFGLTDNPQVVASLTVALALFAGVITQSVARHLRVPGIALLLGMGVILGPDLLGIVRPSSLGSGLSVIVGMAVAVILFEGGMGLNFRELRKQTRPIWLLLTVGPLITTIGGALGARYFLGWEWSQAFLFGTLVIVTGPTVVQPLMRRMRIRASVRGVLEAEGVFIDAIGATVAVVALSLVTQSSAGISGSVLLFFQKISFGVVAGALGGLLIAWLLRSRRIVHEGMENIFALSLVLALYQVCHAIFPESGIAAVTIAGLVVGNVRTPALSELREFKEQLTVMLIGMLFILLAADVRLTEVTGLGWGGMFATLLLMLVVRPLTVAAATWKSAVTLNERAFIAWVAPRGIVAAAVASLFAEELEAVGLEGGLELRALVFLVIATTVVVQGTSGGLLAQLLGLKRPANNGFVVLGAGTLGLALGKALKDRDGEVVFMDSNPHRIRRAEKQGFRSILGNALEELPLQLAEVDTRAGCISVTTNEQMNLLFARKVRETTPPPRAYVAVEASDSGITSDMVHESGATVVFGGPCDLETWSARLDRREAGVEAWEFRPVGDDSLDSSEMLEALRQASDHVLPLVLQRGTIVLPLDDLWEPQEDDIVSVALLAEGSRCLERLGWSQLDALV